MWHLQGLIPRQFAKHDGKTGEGGGGTPPLFYFIFRGIPPHPSFTSPTCHWAKMMGDSTKGDTPHPPHRYLLKKF